MPQMSVAWTIAGSDSGGGAGIQADIQTFHDFGLHGASVVTCVTAQNTIALSDNHVVPATTVGAQLHALRDDLPPAAIKIGALGSNENAAAVLDFLDALPRDSRPFVVWDPVRMASVGGTLGVLSDDTVRAFVQVRRCGHAQRGGAGRRLETRPEEPRTGGSFATRPGRETGVRDRRPRRHPGARLLGVPYKEFLHPGRRATGARRSRRRMQPFQRPGRRYRA